MPLFLEEMEMKIKQKPDWNAELKTLEQKNMLSYERGIAENSPLLRVFRAGMNDNQTITSKDGEWILLSSLDLAVKTSDVEELKRFRHELIKSFSQSLKKPAIGYSCWRITATISCDLWAVDMALVELHGFRCYELGE